MADTIRNETNNLAQWSLTGAAKRLVPQFVRDLIVSMKAWVAPAFVALADGATITWDTGGYPTSHATVTIAGTRALDVNNLVAGASGILIVTQGSGGSHGLTLPAGSKVVGGALTLSTAAGDSDVLSFVYDGTSLWWTYGTAFA